MDKILPINNTYNTVNNADVYDIKQMITTIFESVMKDLPEKIEMLLLAQFTAGDKSTMTRTLFMFAMSIILKYLIGYVSFSIKRMLKEYRTSVEIETYFDSKLMLALNRYIYNNRKDIGLDDYEFTSITYSSSSKKQMEGRYYGIYNTDNDSDDLSFETKVDNKYSIKYKDSVINFIKHDVTNKGQENINAYVPFSADLKRYVLKFSSSKIGTVYEFIKDIIKEYDTYQNSECVHIVDVYAAGVIGGQNKNSKKLNLNKTLDKLYLPSKLEDQFKVFLRDYKNILDRKEEIGMSRKIGIIMSGHSGCGKTSSVFVMSKELGMPIYKIKPPIEANLDKSLESVPPSSIVLIDDFDSSYFGKDDSAKKLQTQAQSAVEKLKIYENNKIHIDNSSMMESSEFIEDATRKMVLNKLLSIFDGYYGLKDCILVITTNRPENIEPELLRPGRIDYQFDFGKKLTEEQLIKSVINSYGSYDVDLFEKHKETIIKNKTMADIMSAIATYKESDDMINSLI